MNESFCCSTASSPFRFVTVSGCLLHIIYRVLGISPKLSSAALLLDDKSLLFQVAVFSAVHCYAVIWFQAHGGIASVVSLWLGGRCDLFWPTNWRQKWYLLLQSWDTFFLASVVGNIWDGSWPVSLIPEWLLSAEILSLLIPDNDHDISKRNKFILP